MPSTISAGTTAGTAIAIAGDTTGNLAFQTNGTTTAMTIDTSQNVGIGTSSPSSPLNVVSASSSLAIAINGRSSDSLGAMYFYANNGSTQYSTITASATEFRLSSIPAAAVQTFYTNGSERMRLDASGNLLFNSGYGSVATAYGCRAWVRFNGNPASPTINASGNISSVTKLKAGAYTVNFTNSMPDVNYSVAGTTSYQGNLGGTGSTYISIGDIRTSAVEVGTLDAPANAYYDTPTVMISVFR